MSESYSPIPPIVRVEDADGGSVVINLNHVVAVTDTIQHTDQPTPSRSTVRLSTGDTIGITMTPDEFWDML
jgi:hypothetical protein